MKTFLVLCVFLFVATFLFPYEYIMNTNPSGIGSHTGNVQISTLTGGDWDDGYYDLALPTINQFYYYGKKVTHLRICTNGYVVMGFGSASGNGTNWGNDSIPQPTNTPNGMVAPFWDDLALSGSALGAGTLHYEIVTNVNNNNWVSVEWRGVQRRNVAGEVFSFSCAFCSANNCYRPNAIIFVFADMDSGNATYDYGKAATVGIEGPVGTVGEQFSCNEAIVTNGLKIVFTPFVPIYGSTTDVSGSLDGYPDATVFRPSNGWWYFKNSDGTTSSWKYGAKGDIAVPGDYDGDGDSDDVVFRPSNSTWYSEAPAFIKQFGTSGDIPVPADYNGDGSLDLAVFRPSNGTWYIYYLISGTSTSFKFGTAGDIPLPAAYDADDSADFGVFRPSNNTWYIHRTSDGGVWTKVFGTAGDIPMPTEEGCLGYSQLTVFRPSNGNWYALDQVHDSVVTEHWGQNGDVPVPADTNDGCATDMSVFRPAASSTWYLSYPTSSLPASFAWGTLGDKPRFRCSFLVVSPQKNNEAPDHN